MAAPAYSHDLITIALGNIGTDAGTWDESSNAAWDDGGAMVDDANLYYVSAKCVSAQFTKDGVGSIIYGHTGAFTIPADGAALIHHLWAAPPALQSYANGGISSLIGNSFGDLKVYRASGSDRFPSPKGGWATYAVDPAQTTDQAAIGSPSGIYTHVGVAVKATAQARGNPNVCNAVRYGRCNQIYTDGDAATPAVLSGFAVIDNAATVKLGLLEELEKGYKQRGLMSLGTVSTPVYFEDANQSIVIADTPSVSQNFNRCEVVNAASHVKWTAFNISSLGSHAKYRFEVIDDAATVIHDSCTFEDDDTFKYGSGSTVISTTHRRCEPVSQRGATMTGGTIDTPFNTVGMYVTNLSLVTGYTFNSDGTGHAIDMGTISTDVSVNYDNTDTGYAATDGNTGSETILVNVDSGFTLTINVASGATVPTINNTGLGSVSVISGQVTTTLSGHPVGATVIVYDLNSADPQNLGDRLATFNSAAASVQYQYSGGKAGDDVQIKALMNGYRVLSEQYVLSVGDNTFNTTMETETN